VAFVVVSVIMIFVIPAFKEVFTSFGADLPAPTLLVIAMSEFFVQWWWLIFGGLIGGVYFFCRPGSATSACRCSWTGCC
jgi:type IV pilus assembly protein PilC